MFYFFRHAIDSKLTASPAYFALLQDQFRGDKSSGFIHVQASPDLQAALLFIDGSAVSSFRLDPSGNHLLPPGALDGDVFRGEATMRLLVAPSLAVRSIWQALEWHPPECLTMEARRFNNHLYECRRQKISGMLHITTPVSDGFLALLGGEVHNSETIFGSQRGFDDTSPLVRRVQDAPSEPWDVGFYAYRPECPSGQQFVLRLALEAWTNHALSRYQQMVGQNMLINANYQLNTQARKHHLDIHTVGINMIDHHFFADSTRLVDAYRLLLPYLLGQMVQVIGAQLTRRIVDVALQSIHPLQKKAMEEAGLGAGSSLWKF